MSPLPGNAVTEGHGGGRDEGHAEESGKDFANIAVGQFDFMAEIHGDGFGKGADLTVSQLAISHLEDLPAATGAEGEVVGIFGHQGSGLQNDVFLKLDMGLVHGLKIGGLAVWAGMGRGDVDGSIDMVWGAALPGRVPLGRASLAWRRLLGGV